MARVAANIARGLASAGHDVYLIGAVGRDPPGDALLANLHSWGVNTDHVRRRSAPTSQAILLIDGQGERCIIGLHPLTDEDLCLPQSEILAADCFYVEGGNEKRPILRELARRKGLTIAAPPISVGIWPAHIIVGSENELPEQWHHKTIAEIREEVGYSLEYIVVTEAEWT